MRRRVSIVLAAVLVVMAIVLLWQRSVRDGDVGEPSSAGDRAADSTGLAAPPKPLKVRDRGSTPAMPVAPVAGTPSVHGVVTSAPGVPAPGAAVEVVVRRGRALVERTTTTAGEDGAYRVELPTLATLHPDVRAASWIEVYARLAGREPGSDVAEIASMRDHEVRIDVVLGDAIAQAITGRLLDATGAAAAAYSVVACDGGDPAGAAQTDADGRFVVAVRKPGTYVAQAWRSSEGMARSDPVSVAAGQTSDAGTLRLRPMGVIEGRVELPDGTVAPPTEIVVEPADVQRPHHVTCASPTEPFRAETDSTQDGRFAFRTLPPGRYRLHAARGSPSAPVVETDARGVTVVVQQRFVLIHVVDADGRPFEGSTYSYEEDRDVPEDGATGVGGSTDSGATHVLLLSQPATLRVDVSTETLAADVLRVELPPDRWLVEATAVLLPKRQYGKIRLDLVDEGGKPVLKFHAEARALIGEGRTGSVVVAAWSSKDGPVSKPVRPGRYELLVSPGFEDEIPDDPGGRGYGLQRAEVVVPEGSEGVAHMVAKAGGWLRVTITTPDGKDDVWCEIRREGHETDRPLWGRWLDPTVKGQWREAPRSGRPQLLAQPLAPGRYLLSTSGGLARNTTAAFAIRTGETTDVEVKLEPR